MKKQQTKPGVPKHGSMPWQELEALGIDPHSVIDFSATVNPFPVPRSVHEAIAQAPLAAYPDDYCSAGVKSIADFYSIPPEWIAISAGLTDVIFALPRILDRGLELTPTYSDYRRAFVRAGKTMRGLPFLPANRRAELWRNVAERDFEILIICNPNNPDGTSVSQDEISELCLRYPERIICIDESYQELSGELPSSIPLLEKHPNLLLLKSLSKPFGIGGLRMAYCLSSGDLLQRIRQELLPWGVSAVAQAVIPVLFAEYSYFAQTWKQVLAEKEWMCSKLQKTSGGGFPIRTGACPYFLVQTGNATELRAHFLREHQMVLRDCSTFGMPDTIRIMPSLPENNRKLLNLLY